MSVITSADLPHQFRNRGPGRGGWSRRSVAGSARRRLAVACRRADRSLAAQASRARRRPSAASCTPALPSFAALACARCSARRAWINARCASRAAAWARSASLPVDALHAVFDLITAQLAAGSQFRGDPVCPLSRSAGAVPQPGSHRPAGVVRRWRTVASPATLATECAFPSVSTLTVVISATNRSSLLHLRSNGKVRSSGSLPTPDCGGVRWPRSVSRTSTCCAAA